MKLEKYLPCAIAATLGISTLLLLPLKKVEIVDVSGRLFIDFPSQTATHIPLLCTTDGEKEHPTTLKGEKVGTIRYSVLGITCLQHTTSEDTVITEWVPWSDVGDAYVLP
jgi:hypothetical protein